MLDIPQLCIVDDSSKVEQEIRNEITQSQFEEKRETPVLHCSLK